MHPPRIHTTGHTLSRKLLTTLLPFALLLAMLLNGCTVKQPVSRPQYPKQPPPRTSPAKVPPPSGYPTRTVPTPRPEVVTPPHEQEPAAVYKPKLGPGGALYGSARKELAEGNYRQAEMTLERALRIEPRNAHYWYAMAQVKYQQKQYAQTVHLCSKSKSLAGKDTQLLRLNDELSAVAQQQLSR